MIKKYIIDDLKAINCQKGLTEKQGLKLEKIYEEKYR